MALPRILFVTPSFQSFVLMDVQILSKNYDLVINHYNWEKKFLAPVYLLMQFFHVLSRIKEVKFVVVHFGGYWSFFPALLGRFFRKPVYIVLHGTDCASLPQFNYGSLRIPLLKWFCYKSYRWATALLPVSQSLVKTQSFFLADGKPVYNGFMHHFPQLQTKYHVIPNGFDTQFWDYPEGQLRTPNSFISVFSKAQFMLKGGDLIVDLAKKLKHCSFEIAGMEKPQGLDVPDNLTFVGKVSPTLLRQKFQNIRYYLQLSVYEGFGCALCEAMLCGCVPIVSEVNAMPYIIGEAGDVVPKRELRTLEKVVNIRLNNPFGDHESKMSRSLVLSRFSKEQRSKSLLDLFSKN
jgi:glycosyltransferase involved in cell wall biosynthesis